MGQAERLTLFDARRWADWQTERTGELHVVYKREALSTVHGIEHIREAQDRYFVRAESDPQPEGTVRLDDEGDPIL